MSKKLLYLMSFVLLLGLAAAPAFAADYHIDPVNGDDDTGDGSLGNPWESFANIISYYTSSYRPSGWVNIAPGDTIYLMNGTHNTIVHPGDGGGPSGGGSHIAYFRTEHGDTNNWYHIKAYPGHSPVIDPQYSGKGINIYQCSYWEVSGIEIKNASSRGLDLADADHIIVHDMEIHDTDGRNDNNVTGLEVGNTGDVEVYNCVFYDNYDRTGAQGHPANSTGMVCFNGFNPNQGDVIVHDCEFYQNQPTSEISGAGLKYKHANQNPSAVFHVYNNTFRNNKYFGVASGTANTHVHHNLIETGGSIRSKDEGGITHQTNQLFEYNTIYKSKAFDFNPSINYRNADFPNDPTGVVYQNNIVYSTASSYDQYSGMVDVGTYIEDDLYDITVAALTFSNNCYYNPNIACKFNFAGGGWASEGGSFTFSGWQTEYGYDTDSVETDPCFVDPENGDFHLQEGSPAEGMGMYAGLQAPGQATNPNPADSATGVSVDTDLSWSAGSGATSHDVYFGTSSPGTFQGNQAATTFEPGTMLFNTTYYWRIDEINDYGTTTGTVWSFATAASVYDVADSDIPVAGTVTGSYTDTQSSDDVYESIEEIESGGKPVNRYTYLEHKWTIDVAGGTTVTFYVEAYHTSNTEGDDFVFAYSTNDSDYTNMVTVTKISDDHTAQSYELPGDTSGQVYIRVNDTDQTSGNRTKDTIYIDDMYIESAGGEPTPGVTIVESEGSTDVDEEGPTSDTYTVVLDTLPTDTVTITVDPDIETEVNSNGAGNPVDLTFLTTNWDTAQTVTVTAIDDGDMENDHTSTITHTAVSNDVDYDAISIDSVIANVADNDCDSSTAHVESIVCDTVAGTQGKKYGRATVTIYDNCGNPVSGADVDGTFTGDYEETLYDQTTNGSGVAVFVTTTQVKKPSFTFCVDDVTHATLTYDPNDNVLTCNSN